MSAEHTVPRPPVVMQLPLEQKYPLAQSATVEHVVLHVVAPHAKGAQVFVVGVGQLPNPSHDDCQVSLPPPQLAATHTVVLVGREPQAVADEPLHCAAHRPEPAHFVRRPCGCPLVTVVQVPRLPTTSHA